MTKKDKVYIDYCGYCNPTYPPYPHDLDMSHCYGFTPIDMLPRTYPPEGTRIPKVSKEQRADKNMISHELDYMDMFESFKILNDLSRKAMLEAVSKSDLLNDFPSVKKRKYIDGMWVDFTDAKPEQIIFNDTTTICIFPGGEKIISRPSDDDDFDPEFGVMACIVKRIYGSRSKFKKAVEEGHRQA